MPCASTTASVPALPSRTRTGVRHVVSGGMPCTIATVQAQQPSCAGRDAGGGADILSTECDGGTAGGDEGVDVQAHGIRLGLECVPPRPREVRGLREHDAGAGVPAPQACGGVGVVAEEEVLDGVGPTARPPVAVRGRRRVDALLVGGLEGQPLLGGQHAGSHLTTTHARRPGVR